MLLNKMVVQPLVQRDYLTAWQAMRDFTDARTPLTADEIWFIEHPPVFTLGQNGKLEHVLNPGDIPVIPVDRGGQVTYHGPGQLMVYVLLDIRRLGMGVRDLVSALEQTIIDLLASYGISAQAKREAPGVYVQDAKICSIGLRIRRGCSYHGLALNVAMDLEPFARINPCGFKNLAMTQISALGGPSSLSQVADDLMPILARNLPSAG
jgi:lipoyl(octanoyl) transferase